VDVLPGSAAHNPKLRAAVAWYGRLTGVPTDATPKHPSDLVSQMHAPVLGLYGAKDQRIPVSDVEDTWQDMARVGKRAELVIYPEAGHAFHADYRPSYRTEDAIDGWARMLAWFRENGV
jgi:carboxymethylenebutenolidase